MWELRPVIELILRNYRNIKDSRVKNVQFVLQKNKAPIEAEALYIAVISQQRALIQGRHLRMYRSQCRYQL